MAYDANDPKDKEIVDALIAEATAPLIAKRDELLTEKKRLQDQLKKGATDPAAIERLEGQIETLQGQLEKATADVKDATKRASKAEKALETEIGFNRKLLVDNGLTDALTKANVASQFLPAAKALLASKVEIKTEGDQRKVMVGDKELGAYVTEWSQGDEGKHYVIAPKSGGGGAEGGADGKGAKTVARAAFDAMTQQERAAFSASGGKVTV